MMRGRTLIAATLFATSLAMVPVASGTVVAASPGDVLFNEIHYHPEDDHPDGEFLELVNTTGGTVDLSGWCIDGIRFCFPAGSTIGARERLVTTSADWLGALSNGGEDIAIIAPGDVVIDALEYDDKNDWPANTDGNGASLQRRLGSAASDDPGNWAGGPPTPGTQNFALGNPFIIIDDAEHTESPAPGEAVTVTAEAEGVTTARIEYRIGFGPVVAVNATVDGDELSASIPGQGAGELVRYRWIVGAPGRTGTFPRQGDGMTYTGTVVSSAPGSELPRFQWFMDDATYEVARQDLTKRGDDGYPAVFAFDGEIFDNTTVRVKGQTSRFWPKKKWKFVLPNGYDLDFDGRTDDDVDEFALHSGWSDKSFLREILSAELLDEVGLPVSEAFPVRLERNGQFFGLYTYVEQRDGTFRDRQDYGDATVYEVGGNNQFGDMRVSHANLSEDRLRNIYDKDTNEWQNDDELRDLIRLMNAPLSVRADVIAERIDASTIINTIAASAVIQHQDFGLKNYDLRLTDQNLWAITPTDFDMTWGRRWDSGCGGLCSNVVVGGSFEHPGTPLFAAFWFNPEYAAKIRQRIRTIVDENFQPERWNARVTELRDEVAADAAADRAVWGTYFTQQAPGPAADEITNRYINPQHARLLGTLVRQGRVSPIAQPADVFVDISNVVYEGTESNPASVTLTNLQNIPIDISGFEIDAIGLEVTGGTILNPGESAIAYHEDAGDLRGRFSELVFAGIFEDEPVDAEDQLQLTDRQGDVIDEIDLLPSETITKIEGRPGESAFLNLVAARTATRGYLQIVDCDEDPDDTSNLNFDGARQVRAGAAIGEFDADGELCIYNQAPTHVIVDLVGYFAGAAVDDVADERLIDTRESGQKVAAGATVELRGRANSSALVNLVAVRPDGNGFLQVVPCDAGSRDAVSNVNYDRAGQIRSGLAVVRFDAAGTACVYTEASTHVIADLQAYLSDSAIDDVDDVRLVDTRTTPGKPGDGGIVRFAGRPGESALVSIVLNQSTERGFGTVLSCDGAVGPTSTINVDGPGQTIANLTVVEFGADGSACLFVDKSAHVIIDLQGYLDGPSFDDVPDVRLVDTRS